MTPTATVIGGGLAGLSTAWWLSHTHRVTVLEQGDAIGAEASAQNAGMLRRMGEDPYERALAIRTHAHLAELGPELSQVTGAVLALGFDPEHLTDAAAHLRARGIPLSEGPRPPALAGAPIQHTWVLPQERVVDPHALLQHFVRGLRSRAGRIVLGHRVASLDDVAGDAVIVAAGAWSRSLARVPLVPVRRTLIQTHPHPLSAPDHPWTWVDDAGIYARPEAGGWLISACDEAVDDPGEGAGSTGPVTELQRARAWDKLARWMPALADARPRSGWSGLRTFAPDRRPMLGADPERPGVWWAAGLGGFGVSCSIAVGEAVAAWVRDEETPWLHQGGVSPARPVASRWLIRPDGDLRNARLAPSW